MRRTPNDVDCPYCDGLGEIEGAAFWNRPRLDDRMCPCCLGYGYVHKRCAETVDMDKSVDEHEADHRESAEEDNAKGRRHDRQNHNPSQ